jgi:hypothetical protein
MKLEGPRTTWKLGKIFLFIWFGCFITKTIVFVFIYGFKQPPIIMDTMISLSITIIFWISMILFVSTIYSLVENLFKVIDIIDSVPDKNEKVN